MIFYILFGCLIYYIINKIINFIYKCQLICKKHNFYKCIECELDDNL